MAVTSMDEARRALRRRAPAELVGLGECAWLDVKSGPYRLNSPEGKEELAKDVAAFANAPTGGLLLIGFQTGVRDGVEIVSGIGPIPRALVDLDQYRKLVRSRVLPPPRDLEVSWIDCGDERGILVIDIPRQPSSMLPFVVPGPSGKDKASEYSLAVPVREADATHWLPQSEIRRLLALGWADSDGPSDEVLSVLVAKAVSAANSAPEPTRLLYEVGAGVSGWKHEFREVYDKVRQQIPLGNPLTEVYRVGPGVVQRIGPNGSFDGWLLCALPDRQPIVVVESVWEALHAAGRGCQTTTCWVRWAFQSLTRSTRCPRRSSTKTSPSWP